MRKDDNGWKNDARRSEKRKKLFNPRIVIEVCGIVDFESCSQGAARVGIRS